MTERVAVDWAGMFDAPGPSADPCYLPIEKPAPTPPQQLTPRQKHQIALEKLKRSAERFSNDDRRWCTDCQRLTGRGRCTAPAAGLLVASRQYEPSQEAPRRCVAYLPNLSDPDQTPGITRWPWLKDAL